MYIDVSISNKIFDFMIYNDIGLICMFCFLIFPSIFTDDRAL